MVPQVRNARKFKAFRSIQCKPSTHANCEIIVRMTPWNPSMSKMGSSSRAEMFALINDRYPGAPGTALAKAEEADARAKQAQRRDQLRRSAASAELEHLGVKNLSKRRKSSSPYANTIGTNGDTGKANASDAEDKIQSHSATSNAARGNGSRGRRASSRNTSPMPSTATGTSDTAPISASTSASTVSTRRAPHVPNPIRNAPVHPSPLATHSMAAHDLK